MGSGIGKKRKGAVDMGTTSYNEEDWEAYRWCVRNNIAIAPKAKSTTEWYATVRIGNGKTNVSPETYKKTEIWIKLFEYCKYYYDKHRK